MPKKSMRELDISSTDDEDCFDTELSRKTNRRTYRKQNSNEIAVSNTSANDDDDIFTFHVGVASSSSSSAAAAVAAANDIDDDIFAPSVISRMTRRQKTAKKSPTIHGSSRKSSPSKKFSSSSSSCTPIRTAKHASTKKRTKKPVLNATTSSSEKSSPVPSRSKQQQQQQGQQQQLEEKKNVSLLQALESSDDESFEAAFQRSRCNSTSSMIHNNGKNKKSPKARASKATNTHTTGVDDVISHKMHTKPLKKRNRDIVDVPSITSTQTFKPSEMDTAISRKRSFMETTKESNLDNDTKTNKAFKAPSSAKKPISDEEDIVKTIATQKANDMELPAGIRSPSDLKWLLHSDEDNIGESRRYYPCRICDPAEARHVNLDPVWETTEVALVQVLEYPPTKPFSSGRRDRILCDLSSLQSYGEGKEWNKKIWEQYHQQRRLYNRAKNQRLLSESDVMAGYLYLNRILQAAQELCMPQTFETAAMSEDSDDDDDEDDGNSDLETPYAMHMPGITAGDSINHTISNKRAEPLRPGDVLTYCSPIFVAGDPRGARTASVVSTDPKDSFKIRLSNNELIPNNTMVKRIQVYENGKHYPHSGFYRPIDRFVMKKRALENISMKDVLVHQAERMGKILDRNMDALRQKDEGLADFLTDFKPRRQQAADRVLATALLTKKKKKQKQIIVMQDESRSTSDDDDFDIVLRGSKKCAVSSPECSPSLEEDPSSSDSSLELKITKKCPSPSKGGSSTASTVSVAVPEGNDPDSDSDSGLFNGAPSKNSFPVNLPDEFDSDSSIENQGLTLKHSISRSAQQTSSPVKADTILETKNSDRDQGFQLKRCTQQCISSPKVGSRIQTEEVPKKVETVRALPKFVSIDHRNERILPSKRRFLPNVIVKSVHYEVSEGLTKANSRIAHQTTVLESPSIGDETKVHDINDDVARIEQTGRKETNRNLPKRGNTMWIGKNRLKGTDHFCRIKRKGAYTIEEDDIENSSDDEPRRHSRQLTASHNMYSPVAQLSSTTRKKSSSSDKNRLPDRKDDESPCVHSRLESVTIGRNASSRVSKSQILDSEICASSKQAFEPQHRSNASKCHVASSIKSTPRKKLVSIENHENCDSVKLSNSTCSSMGSTGAFADSRLKSPFGQSSVGKHSKNDSLDAWEKTPQSTKRKKSYGRPKDKAKRRPPHTIRIDMVRANNICGKDF